MKAKRIYEGKWQQDENDDSLLFSNVSWTEDGVTHLGTVTEIYSVRGVEYLTVMTIFGKRVTVRKSKVRPHPVRSGKMI